MKWQYVGTILVGVAALITAGVGLYEKVYTVHQQMYKRDNNTKEVRLYGIVEDSDGWVFLREKADVNSAPLAKLLNGTNLEILDTTKNWYKVYTESGRIGYIYNDRLKIFYHQTNN